MLVNGYLLAPLFLIVPLMVSAVLAADAFAGEKERKTLETLLHLPLADRDLFLAKLLSAFVPAWLSWIGFVCFAIVANAVAWPVMHRIFVPTRLWIVMILWVAPAVAALGLGVMVRVSVRARTTQEANQLGGAVILPLIFLAVGQATGLLLVELPVAIAIGAVVWLDRPLAVRTGREALHAAISSPRDVNRPGSASEEHELQDRGAEDQDQQHRERDRGALPHGSRLRLTDHAQVATPDPRTTRASPDRRRAARAARPPSLGRRRSRAARRSRRRGRPRRCAARRSCPRGSQSGSSRRTAARTRSPKLADLVGVDVELRVAEPVDPQHLGDEGTVVVAWHRQQPGQQSHRDRSTSPSSSRSTPLQRCAAAGAKTSRPAKVGPGAGSW